MKYCQPFIPIPKSVFFSWNFSQFYTFYYLRKHVNPDGFFRVNNWIGLKKDPMKISRSTFFKSRGFLEKMGVIKIKHPKIGINSGAKTDGIFNEPFLKINSKNKTLCILKSYLEKITCEADWKKFRLIVLHEIYKFEAPDFSFKTWLSKEYFCPLSGKIIKPKSSNYYFLKEIESKDINPERIFLKGKPFPVKGTNKDNKTLKISNFSNVKKVQSKTLIVEEGKLYLKQFRGEFFEKPMPVKEFNLPLSSYESYKNCLLNFHKNFGVGEIKEERLNLFISLCFLAQTRLTGFSKFTPNKIAKIVLSNFSIIQNSKERTKTNFTNRILKSMEFNQLDSLIGEYQSYLYKTNDGLIKKSSNSEYQDFEELNDFKRYFGFTQKKDREEIFRNELLNSKEMRIECFGEFEPKANDLLEKNIPIPDNYWKDGYNFFTGKWIEKDSKTFSNECSFEDDLPFIPLNKIDNAKELKSQYFDIDSRILNNISYRNLSPLINKNDEINEVLWHCPILDQYEGYSLNYGSNPNPLFQK